MKFLCRHATAAMIVTTAVFVSACGASAKQVREAKTSGYDADFAVVYSEALAAVTKRYPKLADSPRAGVIQTAWHPVNMRDSGNNMGGTRQTGNQPGASQQANAFGQRASARTFYFIRFRVVVLGGRPWRIRLKGEASKWEEGATPVQLRGADTPPWLPGRVDGLRIKIHKRLKKHAVKLKTTVIDPEDKPKEKTIPPVAGLTKEASKVVGGVRIAAEGRRYADLRKLMSDQVRWSLGADPNGDQALIMWQADPSLLSKLAAAIEAGCSETKTQVVCPTDGSKPTVKFAKVAGQWRLVEFIVAD